MEFKTNTLTFVFRSEDMNTILEVVKLTLINDFISNDRILELFMICKSGSLWLGPSVFENLHQKENLRKSCWFAHVFSGLDSLPLNPEDSKEQKLNAFSAPNLVSIEDVCREMNSVENPVYTVHRKSYGQGHLNNLEVRFLFSNIASRGIEALHAHIYFAGKNLPRKLFKNDANSDDNPLMNNRVADKGWMHFLRDKGWIHATNLPKELLNNDANSDDHPWINSHVADTGWVHFLKDEGWAHNVPDITLASQQNFPHQLFITDAIRLIKGGNISIELKEMLLMHVGLLRDFLIFDFNWFEDTSNYKKGGICNYMHQHASAKKYSPFELHPERNTSPPPKKRKVFHHPRLLRYETEGHKT
jgi:hypothetical protein